MKRGASARRGGGLDVEVSLLKTGSLFRGPGIQKVLKAFRKNSLSLDVTLAALVVEKRTGVYSKGNGGGGRESEKLGGLGAPIPRQQIFYAQTPGKKNDSRSQGRNRKGY